MTESPEATRRRPRNLARQRLRALRPVVDPALDERLRNWARCFRADGVKAQHCRSMEWQFSIPKFRAMDAAAGGMREFEVIELMRTPAPEPVDQVDAERVETALTSRLLLVSHYALIRGYYLLGHGKHDIRPLCRALRIPFHEFDSRLFAATGALAHILRIIDMKEKK